MRNVKYIRGTIEKPEASGKNTKLVYNIYEEWDNVEDLNFMVGDVVGLAKDIGFIIDKLVEIQYIHVDEVDRGFRFGDEMLTQFLHIIGAESKDSNTIIIIRAAPLKFDYTEEPPKGIYEDELIRQSLWLENRGFRNINSLCGFENGIPYMYINHSSKKLLEAIITREVTSPRNAIGANMIPDDNSCDKDVKKASMLAINKILEIQCDKDVKKASMLAINKILEIQREFEKEYKNEKTLESLE